MNITGREKESLSQTTYFASLQKHKGVSDPLDVVAGEISEEAILLCLDEFMVIFFPLDPLSRFYCTLMQEVELCYDILHRSQMSLMR